MTIKKGENMVYAVLLAGRIGNRMKTSLPKQFLDINGKPLIIHCISNFLKIPQIRKVIVSSPKNYLKYTQKLIIENYPKNDKIMVIEGGHTRQDTLMNSINKIEMIKETNNPVVLAHDVARMFVSKSLIKKSIFYAQKYGASSPIIPSVDIIIETKNNSVKSMPNRDNIYNVQTPQAFKLLEYKKLFESLSPDEKNKVKETVSVYFLRNKKVYLFNGDPKNFKITHPSDLDIARNMKI